ncbi:MAG: hypothetical protein ACOY94_03575 [Bacillota bacterium]
MDTLAFRRAYAYSLARSLDDQHYSLMDALVPFVTVLLGESEDGKLRLNHVQGRLLERFGLSVPMHALSSAAARAKQLGYVTRHQDWVYLDHEGKQEYSNYKSEAEVRRELNFLAEHLRTHYEKEGFIPPETDALQDMFIRFVERNIAGVSLYLNDATTYTFPSQNELNGDVLMFIHFIERVEESNPDLFRIVNDIAKGAAICTLLQVRNPDDLSATESFHAFLDTNVVFSILGYDDPRISVPSREMHALLRSAGHKLYVFDFTIQEIVRVLSGFKTCYHQYWTGVTVNSIYSRLKATGKKPSDVVQIITTIEEILQELGIEVYPTGDQIPVPQDKELPELDYQGMRRYKPDRNLPSLTHDLLVVQHIKKLRQGEVRRLGRAKYVFISSDIAFARYSFEHLGHRDNFTIAEVLLDRFVTTTLWFRSPGTANLPIHAVIAAHASRLLVDRQVWTEFLRVLKKMRDEGRINDADLADIAYRGRLQDHLLHADLEHEGVVESAIEDILAEARVIHDQERKENAAEVANLSKALEETKTDLHSADTSLERVFANIQRRANTSTRRVIKMVWIAIWLGIAAILGVIEYFLYSFNVNLWAYAVPVLGLLAALKLYPLDVPTVLKKLEVRLHRHYTAKWQEEIFGQLVRHE